MENIIRREPIGDNGRTIPVVLCWCKREVWCEYFTNTCDCGADYNFSGQRLASREQWGEETGETAGDILNCDCENFDWGTDY